MGGAGCELGAVGSLLIGKASQAGLSRCQLPALGAAMHSAHSAHSRARCFPPAQLAVYGKESMRRMATASVLVCGMGGLGVETGRCGWVCRGGAEGTGRSCLLFG